MSDDETRNDNGSSGAVPRTDAKTSGAVPPVGERQIQKIGIKVPPFWHDCPEIWFAQIEAQFAVGKITSDTARFNTIVASIESKVLCQVSDAVLNPPTHDKYANIKAMIISRYSDSAQCKMQKLLSEMSLGDQKPSQLLAEMKRLGGTTVTDDFMKTLWLSNLPQQTKAILSTNDVGLTQLAVLADKIMEVSQGVGVQSVERSSHSSEGASGSSSSLERKIDSLTRAIEKLTASSSSSKDQRSRSASRSNTHTRSNTPSDKKREYEFCWYHHKFGNQATKCNPPCKFKPAKN